MTTTALPLPRADPADSGPDLHEAPGPAGIDPDDTEVVPAALSDLVTSARMTYRAIQANGWYPAIMAVGAVEDTVAAPGPDQLRSSAVRGRLLPVWRRGRPGAHELLDQARAALSDTRHHLARDEDSQPCPAPALRAAS